MPTLPTLIAEFCDELVAHDLPDLPGQRRMDVVAFAGRRVDGLPSPMRLGVGVVAATVGIVARLAGRRRTVSFLTRHPPPLVGEYVRLLRSLAYAYVWETWPDTTNTGQSTPDPVLCRERPSASAASVAERREGAARGGLRGRGTL